MNARLQSTQAPSFELDAEQSLGQIAVELPGATAVFRRLKLDFCCGGQVSLRQSAQDKGLDLQPLLAELGALQREGQVDLAGDPASLIAYILERYHAVHRAQLPELLRMARRVEAVHRDNPHVPAGLADLPLEITDPQDQLRDLLRPGLLLEPEKLLRRHPAPDQPTHAIPRRR